MWVRADVFRRLGGFDESIVVNEDTEFAIRLARQGAVMWFDGEVRYIQHQARDAGDQGSVTSGATPATRLNGFKRILELHGDFLAVHAPKLRRQFVARIWKYRLKGALGDHFRSRKRVLRFDT
ncbi:MAG: hypothetical protein F4Y60_07275 [Boseongicola sp. SB0664_bin_43]|uniref:Glycosyltransferase family 2 protein n=1 Tax=Boseongicola sp. SB0664_bin_43 TaxID=2604844 RepID=A0A6B0Y283_9RHOB|nr:hypothetical protein [Boseongicola sp. SB0664_bin_43]